jgi:hypothetical protein
MDAKKGTFAVKVGLAQMLKGGVIMDVVNAVRPCSRMSHIQLLATWAPPRSPPSRGDDDNQSLCNAVDAGSRSGVARRRRRNTMQPPRPSGPTSPRVRAYSRTPCIAPPADLLVARSAS